MADINAVVRRVYKSPSLEKRQLLVDAMERQEDLTLTCTTLGITYSTGRRVWQNFRRTGSIEMPIRGGFKKRKLEHT